MLLTGARDRAPALQWFEALGPAWGRCDGTQGHLAAAVRSRSSRTSRHVSEGRTDRRRRSLRGTRGRGGRAANGAPCEGGSAAAERPRDGESPWGAGGWKVWPCGISSAEEAGAEKEGWEERIRDCRTPRSTNRESSSSSSHGSAAVPTAA